MEILKAPEIRTFNDKSSVFLAGSIDNGASEEWQITVTESLSDLDVYVLNPRRDEWDSSWDQTVNNPKFKEQVLWELYGLENSRIILFNFLGASQAPISLLELGFCSKKGNVVICCETEYWRRGNIEVVAEKFEIPLFDNLEETIQLTRELLIQS